jgi:hypothetical protein
MQTFRTLVAASCLFAGSLALVACDGKDHSHGTATSGAKPKADDHGHAHGDGHTHGPVTQLGEQTAGGYTVKASRDGELKPGGDAPIDVWITGGAAKIAAVRFWIGTEDAAGAVKAKAELEKDNWHTHVEVPSPLPAESKLWVEIEAEGGEKTLAGFALQP